VLLATDLHGDNILAAQREPWLVIDPKPYVGDPAYDLLQHMLNCEDRLAAEPGGLATRMAALAGVNPGQAGAEEDWQAGHRRSPS
jgi:streptomycin 6-kinase